MASKPDRPIGRKVPADHGTAKIEKKNAPFHWGWMLLLLTVFQLFSFTQTLFPDGVFSEKLGLVFLLYIAVEWLYIAVARMVTQRDDFALEIPVVICDNSTSQTICTHFSNRHLTQAVKLCFLIVRMSSLIEFINGFAVHQLAKRLVFSSCNLLEFERAAINARHRIQPLARVGSLILHAIYSDIPILICVLLRRLVPRFILGWASKNELLAVRSFHSRFHARYLFSHSVQGIIKGWKAHAVQPSGYNLKSKFDFKVELES